MILCLITMQVTSSETFTCILQSVLAIGNYLNYGLRLGSAVAFRLKVLRKLADTKSLDGSQSLLAFVARSMLERNMPPVKEQMHACLSGALETSMDVRPFTNKFRRLLSRKENIVTRAV